MRTYRPVLRRGQGKKPASKKFAAQQLPRTVVALHNLLLQYLVSGDRLLAAIHILLLAYLRFCFQRRADSTHSSVRVAPGASVANSCEEPASLWSKRG